MKKELDSKKKGALMGNIKKIEGKIAKIKSELEKFEKAKVPPSEFFSKAEYSQFDQR